MNLIDFLHGQRVPYRKTGKYGEIYICCPFCEDRGEPSPDEKFRLGLNFTTQQGHCFRCDWASKDNAVALVLDQLDITSEPDFDAPVQKEEAIEDVVLPEDFQVLSTVTKLDGPGWTAYKYMRDRGFTRQLMTMKQIGVSLIGRYRYRIIFPVYWRGKLRGLVARDFTGQAKAKYLNSRGEKYLYNMPPRSDRVILAEGAFKALAIEQAVKEPAAAVLGHSLTSRMVKQLKYAKCKEVTIWPDPDNVGKEGALSIAQELNDSFKVFVIVPVPSKQADELTEDKIRLYYSRRQRFNWAVEQKVKSSIRKES